MEFCSQLCTERLLPAGKSSECQDSQLARFLRMCDCGCSALNRTPRANIVIGELLKCLFQYHTEKTKVLHDFYSVSFKVLARTMRQEKEGKGIQKGKEKARMIFLQME